MSPTGLVTAFWGFRRFCCCGLCRLPSGFVGTSKQSLEALAPAGTLWHCMRAPVAPHFCQHLACQSSKFSQAGGVVELVVVLLSTFWMTKMAGNCFMFIGQSALPFCKKPVQPFAHFSIRWFAVFLLICARTLCIPGVSLSPVYCCRWPFPCPSRYSPDGVL